MATEARIRANKKYNDENLMRIVIQPHKEEGQAIKQAAAQAGQSVTQYILDAVRERMRSGK